MWQNRSFGFFNLGPVSGKKSRFIDRDFQIRHIGVLVLAAVVGMSLMMFPLYYFLNQNYEIFLQLSYERAPDMLDYLQREQAYIKILFAAVFLGVIVFFSVLGFKMSERIVGPLMVLSNHIKVITRGHWYKNPVKIRENDEFQELIDTYNYFYQSFQKNIEAEYAKLKRIDISQSDPNSKRELNELIKDKQLQLQLLIANDSSLKTVESPASRTAS